jgi:glycosyltransferase involved in cell wall biosynthesis
MKSVGVYISNYNQIGGVERFCENLCKRMAKHYDITFMYDWYENPELLLKMAKHVKVAKLKPATFDYFICSTAWGVSPYDFITAEKVIQVVHADYRHVIQNWNFNYKKHPKVTHHVCVGNLVKEGFEEATPYKCDAIIHNLLDNALKLPKKRKNKVLNLITVSRLSSEKGFKRMVKFAELLELNKINYIWNVYGKIYQEYTNDFLHLPKVKFQGVTTEPLNEIVKADYLVQLSDTEGFAYSVYEALQTKTPCIITPFLSGKEQITHGVNGWIVPFDLQNIDLKTIINNIPVVTTFEELGKEEHWINFLENGKSKIKIKDNF